MKKILIFIYLIFYSINAFSSEIKPLIFTQIISTPDQAIGAEILQVAYKKLNIPIRIKLVPGKRALMESSSGRADGEIYRIFEIDEVYPTLIRVPTPINYIEPSVFAITPLNITKCSQLKGRKIGIVRGVYHSRLCTEGMKKITMVDHSDQLIQILNNREVDAVVTAKINGILQMKKHGYIKIRTLNPPLSKMFLYHYLHEKHRALVPKIDRIFKEMEKTGELEKIRQNVIKRLLKEATKY